MDADWLLVVDKTEAVPGCNIEDELQKRQLLRTAITIERLEFLHM
jgi:hypothetical protein